jgi:hypothetical protein
MRIRCQICVLGGFWSRFGKGFCLKGELEYISRGEFCCSYGGLLQATKLLVGHKE